MNMYNFTGRLGKDAEVRHSKEGKAVCSFSVAVDYGFGDNKGTNWVKCVMFGNMASGSLPRHLKKGGQVAVSGELKLAKWQAKDGTAGAGLEVIVSKLDLLGGKVQQGQHEEPSVSDSHIPF